MSAPDRRAKLDRDAEVLSIRRQCTLLGVTRSGVYRARKAANDIDIALMRRLDEMFNGVAVLRLTPDDRHASR